MEEVELKGNEKGVVVWFVWEGEWTYQCDE